MSRVLWIGLFVIVLASGCLAADPMEILQAEAPKYVVPEDNAWDYMARAGTLANEVDLDADWPILADASAGNVEEVDLQMVDDAYGEALVELRKGLYKECVTPADMLDPYGDLRVYTGFRQLARVLILEARGYVGVGEADKALASCQDSLRLARNISQNGALIHNLVAIACSSIAAKYLSTALNVERPDAAKLREFVVWNEANRKSWQSATGSIANEVLHFLPAINEDKTVQMRSEEYTEFACQAIDWAKKPAWERGIAPERGEDNDLSPVYAKYVQRREINDASLAGLSLRCALEAYQSENGSYPDELSELVRSTSRSCQRTCSAVTVSGMNGPVCGRMRHIRCTAWGRIWMMTGGWYGMARVEIWRLGLFGRHTGSL